MKIKSVYKVGTLCLAAAHVHAQRQKPLENDETAREGARQYRVGIIGGGPAGISAGYHLQKFSEAAGINVSFHITTDFGMRFGRVFADGGYTTNEYKWLHNTEAGAFGFSKHDRIINEWINEFGLDTIPAFDSRYKNDNWYCNKSLSCAPGNSTPTTLGIWDGRRFFINETGNLNHWQPWWKIIPGLEPEGEIIDKLADAARYNFSKLYEPPIYPFANLTQAIIDAGLYDVLSTPALEYLEPYGVSRKAWDAILQPILRRSRATNLETISTVALPALLSVTSETPLRAKSKDTAYGPGNIDLLIEVGSSFKSGDYETWEPAELVTYNQDGDIGVQTSDWWNVVSWYWFDELIIATPQEGLDIEFIPAVPWNNEAERWSPIYTSFIATPHELDPVFFNLPRGTKLPDEILTTCDEHSTCTESDSTVLSIMRLGHVQKPPCEGCNPQPEPPLPPAGPLENLFQLTTSKALNADLLTRLFNGVSSANDSSRSEASEKMIYNQCSNSQYFGGDFPLDAVYKLPIDPKDISWWCTAEWRQGLACPPYWSYDTWSSTDNQPSFKMDKRIWYTSAIEAIDSSMEAAALAGRNVARLLVDKWASGNADAEDEQDRRDKATYVANHQVQAHLSLLK